MVSSQTQSVPKYMMAHGSWPKSMGRPFNSTASHCTYTEWGIHIQDIRQPANIAGHFLGLQQALCNMLPGLTRSLPCYQHK